LAKIALDSAIGEDVPNEQVQPVADIYYQNFLSQVAKKCATYGNSLRPGPIIRYNCHGFTFASRRTWIDDIGAVIRILSEDGYERVTGEILPGDVAVYFDSAGKPEHSGLVIESPLRDGFGYPRIVSKWAWANEVVHWANQCEYGPEIRYYRITRCTLKPEEANGNLILS